MSENRGTNNPRPALRQGRGRSSSATYSNSMNFPNLPIGPPPSASTSSRNLSSQGVWWRRSTSISAPLRDQSGVMTSRPRSPRPNDGPSQNGSRTADPNHSLPPQQPLTAVSPRRPSPRADYSEMRAGTSSSYRDPRYSNHGSENLLRWEQINAVNTGYRVRRTTSLNPRVLPPGQPGEPPRLRRASTAHTPAQPEPQRSNPSPIPVPGTPRFSETPPVGRRGQVSDCRLSMRLYPLLNKYLNHRPSPPVAINRKGDAAAASPANPNHHILIRPLS